MTDDWKPYEDAPWYPIAAAPRSRLILGWMEGWEEHSGVRWRRNGFALIAMHQDKVAPHLYDVAVDQIIGKPENPWRLEATHWTPLPTNVPGPLPCTDWHPIRGDMVTYVPYEGCPESQHEKGVVKSVTDDGHAFVVYHCAEDWENMDRYTAAKTRLEDLKPGWPPEGPA